MPEGAIRDKNIRLCGLGYDSRYGDLLGAERSGDPVPLEARFFPPVRTVSGSSQSPVWVQGLIPLQHRVLHDVF